VDTVANSALDVHFVEFDMPMGQIATCASSPPNANRTSFQSSASPVFY